MCFADMVHNGRRRDGRQGAAHYVWDQDTGPGLEAPQAGGSLSLLFMPTWLGTAV